MSDDAFHRHRRLVFTVAYDILGSVIDAEDVVQEAWLRWTGTDHTDVTNPRAYLVRIATRLALNQLRSARARREVYVGPWLPEPLATAGPPTDADPADRLDRVEAVSLAMLVVLETLSPLERAVFVLREVFGMSYREIGEILDRSEASVRQLAHRAREHVRARQPRFTVDDATQEAVTERFLAACRTGDTAALVAAMAPDATWIADGGGRARAALRPIVGAEKIARLLVTVTAEVTGGVTFHPVRLNGAPGMVVRAAGSPVVAAQLVIGDGLVQQFLVVQNPEKLTGVGPTATGSR